MEGREPWVRFLGERVRFNYHLLGTRTSLVDSADTGISASHEKKEKKMILEAERTTETFGCVDIKAWLLY